MLHGFLYDAFTARKAKAQTTGNASRGYSSLPHIGTNNLYLEPGTQTPEELIREVKSGFYVTAMLGRGANPVTGEYSRGANGLWIENGELTLPGAGGHRGGQPAPDAARTWTRSAATSSSAAQRGRAHDPLPTAHRLGRIASSTRRLRWRASLHGMRSVRMAAKSARKSAPRSEADHAAQAAPQEGRAEVARASAPRRWPARPPRRPRRAAPGACARTAARCSSVYRDPLGGHTVVFAVLPIDKVEPTPYQRDLSEPHVKRLATAMERLDRFLDPVIAVRKDGKYWTPNGNHRLGAVEAAGREVHRRAGAARGGRGLPNPRAQHGEGAQPEGALAGGHPHVPRPRRRARPGNETDFAHLFEEPSFITLGAAYEKRPRFSAGAYHPFVKRVEGFLDVPLAEALAVREARAEQLLELDDAVVAVVDALKERGLQSPYLKNFVVARHQLPALPQGRRPAELRRHREPRCWPAPGASTWTRCAARTLAAWAAAPWNRTKSGT